MVHRAAGLGKAIIGVSLERVKVSPQVRKREADCGDEDH